MRVLIVEDNHQFAEVLNSALSGEFHVELCASAQEAIKLLQAKPYDVVVSDFVLQGGSGLDVAAHVKNLDPAPKIVIMTAFAEKDMAIEALNAGVSHFLEKPFTIAKLREVLHRHEAIPAGSDVAAKLNPETNSVVWKGATVRLTPSEYLILSYLMTQRGGWIPREELEKMLWDTNPNVSRNVLDTHIYNLRRKIPDLTEQLAVVRGKGFSLKELA